MKQSKKLSRRDAFKILGATLGATVLANLPSKWSKPELVSGVLPAHAQSTSTPTLPTVRTISMTLDISSPPPLFNTVTFDGDVSSDGGAPILERGFIFSITNPPPKNPTGHPDYKVIVGPAGTGTFQLIQDIGSFPSMIYGQAYARNSVGTAYGAVMSSNVCLVEGTLVMMADGTTKNIEDIVHSDQLRVWNFDDGMYDQAQPLWIKKEETTSQYNLLEFSDGSSLKTVFQHRIFNKELGAFTFPMTEDTPIGTTTFNVHGQEVKLVSKKVVMEKVKYYNVITYRHMNLFANGVLTSCMYNNVYPIADMKFVKDDRQLIPQSAYGVEDKYYEGLRLAEQTIPVSDTFTYINRLEVLKVDNVKTELETIS